jgi:hypothetical protein
MKIPFSLVPDTTTDRLERILPNGYRFERVETKVDENEKYEIYLGSTYVADVSVEGTGFQFDFSAGSQGSRLEALLSGKYFPTKELNWLLVFPSHERKWGYIGSPATSKDEALANIGPLVMKQGTMLIGFYSNKWDEMVNGLEYDYSFQLLGTVEDPSLGLTDLGPAMIEFTTLESG